MHAFTSLLFLRIATWYSRNNAGYIVNNLPGDHRHEIKHGNLLMTSLHKRHMIEYEDLELYDTNYRIVISDLGQADFVNHKESQPKTGNTGAFGFASPELVLGSDFMRNDINRMNEDQDENKSNDSWDESVDIWSLGHLLYFLTFSRMPYEQCLNDNNNGEDEDLPDLHEFYKDIINGTNKLWIPSNNGRSQVLLQMIKKLCQIEPKQRPSLDSVILAIANILRSHQYISISYSNNDPNRFRALIAPSRSGNENHHNHNNIYPVIKYIPKYKTLQHLLPNNYQNL